MELLLPFVERHRKIQWGSTLEYPSTRSLKLYTHRIFNRYPARSISLVPRQILQSYKDVCETTGTVLDPFMGSGTTAIEGFLAGFSVVGLEIDPFARLVTEVSTTVFNDAELEQLREYHKHILGFFENKNLTAQVPQLYNLNYWFSEENMTDLLRLKAAIDIILDSNTKAHNFFRLVLADIVRPCSKAERQTLKPYISKKHIKTPAPVKETYKKSFEQYLQATREFSQATKHYKLDFKWTGFNAIDFQVENAVDLAITSPPYLNALDYTRCIKIESAWAGCADDLIIKAVKNSQVGDESRKATETTDDTINIIDEYVTQIGKIDARRASVAIQYFEDMRFNLICTYNALRVGGEYHLIVGNSVIRDIEVPTHELLAKIGEKIGFVWSDYFRYRLKDHRLSIPRNNNGGKIEYEHVISLKKV